MTEHQCIEVELGERSYPILIGEDLLGGGYDLSRHVSAGRCCVVSNDIVAPLYAAKLHASLPGCDFVSIVLRDGEQHKTMLAVNDIIDQLTAAGARRDITLIALGGGVVGDIAGFAAACYMRGVDFIQVPTTLLAQVDSSVGGKTGVNHPAGKNLIGAFYQPKAVLIDTGTLTTLPARELRAGLAEVIKYGAIYDANLFAWLERNMPLLLDRDPTALAKTIRRCCEIKAEIVAEDERETGRRAILNFGHTFGHAIERCQGYGDWLHGEAVAVGMVLAGQLSGLAEDDQSRLVDLIDAAGLPTEPPPLDAGRFLSAMGLDKKAVGKSLRFILLKQLGEAYVTSDYSPTRLDSILATV